MDTVTYGAAIAYVKQTANALGAVKGAPCTVKSITESEEGSTVVFAWTGNDGVQQTSTAFIPRGPIGKQGDPGDPGKNGISPSVKVSEINGGHRVTITDANGTHTFDVMDGVNGTGGTVEVDTTLTEAGKAADAKAVGDAIGKVSEEIGDISKLGASTDSTVILFEKELVYEDQSKVLTYPLVLTAGTSGTVEYYVSEKKGQLVIKTMKDGIDVDVILSINPCENNGSAEFTLTKDCDTIKIFTSSYDVHVILSRESSEEATSMPVVDAVLANRKDITEIKRVVDADPLYPYDVLGESMLASNARYNPSDFMRIVMLDNNYKFFSVANIKRIIDQMAAVSLNYLEIGFGGSGYGNCFRLNDMTVTANGETYDISNTLITNYGETLTETDMEEIIDYAASKDIGIIPALNMPGHMAALLNGRSEFWYKGNSASLEINNDKACNFAITIAKKYAKWFAEHGCKFYNLCADEFYDALSGYQSLHAAGDYKYADFINRLAYELSKYRLSLLCWNDPLCIGNDAVPHINRELLVSYWEKREGFATAPELVEQGYKLINSSAAIYWVANDETSVTEAKMRDFQITGFRGGATVAKPVGAKFCIWIGKRENPSLDDDGAAITDTVLPLITAFGETIAPQIEALNT